MPTYLTGQRDKNEKGLRLLISALGGCSIQMHESAGFDLVVIFRNGAHIVEVKNPEKSWKLTPGEIKKKDEVEAAGGVYNIVQGDDDVYDLKEKER